MNPIHPSALDSPKVKAALEALHADAAKPRPMPSPDVGRHPAPENPSNFYLSMKHAYMAVPAEFGKLLYTLARGIGAKTVVEFGTSFGVSTIYLAAAVRDNGGGKIHGSEFIDEKAERAMANLAEAGLADLVEIRVGDALETFASPPSGIDMVFLDGPKDLYLRMLKLLEPELRPGAIIASDNTDHEGMESFLAYLRNPSNGYTSSAILTGNKTENRGHEISIRH